MNFANAYITFNFWNRGPNDNKTCSIEIGEEKKNQILL
jgi:hypothetical protein